MPATTSGQLTVEKTPSYLVSGRVVDRIFAMDSAVRLLVVVRDPVTRAVSDYTQAATKRADIAPFEQLAFVGRNRTYSDQLGMPCRASLSLYTRFSSVHVLYRAHRFLRFVSCTRRFLLWLPKKLILTFVFLHNAQKK